MKLDLGWLLLGAMIGWILGLLIVLIFESRR